MSVTTRRREREKEQRREIIIDAAEALLCTKGRLSATMDDVAMEAEVSKGLLYKYFQSKDDLFEAVSLRAHGRLLALFREAVSADESGRHQVSAIGRAYIAFASEYPVYFEALVEHSTSEVSSDPESYSALCERTADEILDLVRESIERGIADGSIRGSLDPLQTAFMLWGALHGLVVTATFKNVLERHGQYDQAFLNDSLKFLASCMKP
ncbi:MAG: TetR/AcrR family transcriptional regulator [Bacteroidota bacterium]